MQDIDANAAYSSSSAGNQYRTILGLKAVFLHQVNFAGGGDYYKVLGPSVLFS